MTTLPRPPMFALAALFVYASSAPAAEPGVGAPAPTVTLEALDGGQVDLAETFGNGPTVLVVLRGYPGYQCGICSRQVSELIGKADEFADAGVQVVLVYPGEAGGLATRAEEFLGGKTLPASFTMLIDPDYELVNAYDLRWDAANETAYPSTFVIDKSGRVEWAKVSKTHGGRATASEVLAAL